MYTIKYYQHLFATQLQ